VTEETICALSTPLLQAPIAVIRVSGPESLNILHRVFSRPGALVPRYSVYGSIISGEKIIDDVVAVYYESPKSFTGEEMAEICCHGNPIIVKRILELLISCGARHAEPGEFSKRAFLNGKIDLTGAEAINHIISARSEWEIEASLKQMHGSLREKIHDVRNSLLHLKADIECRIDFADEDEEFAPESGAAAAIDAIQELLSDIMGRCRVGERLSHGIDVPIVGKPNVGKSSILNCILNSERAIVSDIPGTTRDLIKETIQFAGIHVNLFDTAGIDVPGCEIEKRGIEMSREKILSSPVIIMVIDAVKGISGPDREILSSVPEKETICLANKIDLVPEAEKAERLKSLAGETGYPLISFSAKTGSGLKELEKELSLRLQSEFLEYRNFFISDMRVIGLLEESITACERVKSLMCGGEPPEIIAFVVQELIDTIMEITGEISPDDVLNSIFSRFCIGK